ncbi:hypothetical protein SAMN05216227_10393 [Pseudorhodobacter antarcticus]|uniref:GIY-YIG domain-containing protein n=1 Tax=Pseudorhodobacter antarcticus TaxID=1077947 RepID=A0A1H8L6N6_9RHOB|nr:hypothetical protein [Pseudorhodobacter antarcticus]SEO00773.1 hypothetical protein SAMN05216227_10393 [Pseudorhodobacter antarcticus]
MSIPLHTLSLPGGMLERGFWLYVWDIQVGGERLLYVGRTGDEGNPQASAPYDRFGQHLGRNKNANALRRNLLARGIDLPQVDHYDFHFVGPIFPETADMESHIPYRDIVAALEKKLADCLSEAGYCVLNKISCRRPLQQEYWLKIRDAFEQVFPELKDF